MARVPRSNDVCLLGREHRRAISSFFFILLPLRNSICVCTEERKGESLRSTRSHGPSVSTAKIKSSRWTGRGELIDRMTFRANCVSFAFRERREFFYKHRERERLFFESDIVAK